MHNISKIETLLNTVDFTSLISKMSNKCEEIIAVSEKVWNLSAKTMQDTMKTVIVAVANKLFTIENIVKMIDAVAQYRPRNMKAIYIFCKTFIQIFKVDVTKSTFKNIVLQALLVKDGLINMPMPYKYRSRSIEQIMKIYDNNTLMYALLWDDENLLESLVKEDDFECDQNLDNNHSILDYAAEFGSYKCFDLLLSLGSTISRNTLERSFIGNNQEIIKTCEKMFSVDQLCLEYSVAAHHNNTAQDLPNFDYSWSSTLQYFNYSNFFDKLSRTKDINSFDHEGYNPILASSMFSSYVVLEYLISKRSNIEIQDSMGNTPLIYSSLNNTPNITDLLITNNAKLGTKDAFGRTAAENAELKQNYVLMFYLKRLENLANEIKISLS